MSTDRERHGRFVHRLLPRLAIVLCLCAPPASASTHWEFMPSLDVALSREGNVQVVGEENISDDVAGVGATFDLSAENPPTLFTFSYEARRQIYQEFSELDFTSHHIVSAVSRQESRRSSFRMDLGWLMTERQPVQTDQPQTPTTLVPRSKQTAFYLDLSGRVAAGRQSFFEWGVWGARNDYSDSGTTGLADNDMEAVSVGFGREIGQRTDVGGQIRAQRLGFEGFESTLPMWAELFFNRDLGRSTRLELRAGAIRADTGTASYTNPAFSADLTHDFPSGTTLAGGLREGVSGGYGVGTGTKDRGIYTSYRPSARTRRYSADVTAYYWRRSGIDETLVESEIQTLEGLATFSWYPRSGRFALGAHYSYHDQTDLAGTAPELETRYSSAGVSFRWFLRRPEGERGRS